MYKYMCMLKCFAGLRPGCSAVCGLSPSRCLQRQNEKKATVSPSYMEHNLAFRRLLLIIRYFVYCGKM